MRKILSHISTEGDPADALCGKKVKNPKRVRGLVTCSNCAQEAMNLYNGTLKAAARWRTYHYPESKEN